MQREYYEKEGSGLTIGFAMRVWGSDFHHSPELGSYDIRDV
jgi:hypothetical protein